MNCPLPTVSQLGQSLRWAEVQIERYLRHLKLWPNANDVVSVHGPPEVFDIDEFERQADWDDFYESQELLKAHDENWAA